MSVNVTRNQAVAGGSGGGAAPEAVAAAVVAAMPAQVSAYPGEYRLFALNAGQTAPDGWVVDTQREVPSGIYTSITGIIPADRSESNQNATSAVIGDYLYQFIGSSVTKTRISDGVRVAVWSTGQSYNQGSRPALCAVGSNLMVVGGATSGGARADVYRVNVETGVFTRLSDMPATRVHTSLVALDDNRFLIVGGNSNPSGEAAPFDTVWLYNVSASTCTLVATLPTAASYIRTARLPSGNVFIAGGLTASGVTLNTYQVLNATTFALSAVKTIPSAYQFNQAREVCTFRTSAGVGYLSAGTGVTNCFSEYHEATDSFSAFQGSVTTAFRVSATNAVYATEANDLRASSYGTVIALNWACPLVIIGAGYAPTYRYCRKT